jgi:hypothetical protein
VTSLQFAVAQEASQGSPAGPRPDRARVDEVHTASGERVTLAVLAEDGSSGAAADWVIGQVFSAVKGARRRHLGEVLRGTLQTSLQALRADVPGGDGLSATAAVIWRGSLYVSHVGHSAAFVIQAGEVRPLTGLGGPRHADPRLPWVESTAMAGRPLGRGDRVILLSPGLLQASPEDGRPFLDPKSMPEYVGGVPPLQAARHLVSIALGRDAPGDLSVVVVAVPGVARRAVERPRRLRTLALAALAVLLLAGAAWWLRDLLPAGLLPGTEALLTDYGYAVMIEGELHSDDEAQGVSRLEPLPPPVTLTATGDSSLRFQSTYAGGSDITATALYLRSGAQVELSALDRRPADAQASALPIRINLLLGEALIVRQSGERDVQVAAPGGYAGLVGPGRAALGVGLDVLGVEVVCLIGTCVYQPTSADPVVLFSGQRLRPQQGGPQLFDSAVHRQWSDLCGGCLAAP